MSMVSGIQGHLLEVTIVGCSQLKDTEWISRQDPYVCIEYASTKFRTRTCTDGGKHPSFQEKTVIPLIEGLREINVSVWNSNTITFDDFIGSCRVQLQKVLSSGYDDSSWPLQSKTGRFAGEVKLIMHYSNAHKSHNPSAGYSSHAPMYMAPPPAYTAPPMGYLPSKSVAAPAPAPSYQLPVVAYPPSGIGPYPPASAAYPTAYPPVSAYPPAPTTGYQYAPQQETYPPPSTYPPQVYPPPPEQAYPAYPPGPYQGGYPVYPPPY